MVWKRQTRMYWQRLRMDVEHDYTCHDMKDVGIEMADPSYQLKQDGWFNLRSVDFYIKVKPRAK